ncbi:hypothetical protein AWB81_06849 [Caballeronia arationis]|jgi:hypothetical protein|uniref:Uncharacterized protein n=1 Tax=Caballeronia arationis TaxID=1777142 RepID=A0A7Z7I7E6_9BURK|nr:hypothetical protein AWB81_06849 [Caballeronia arationis]SOE67113.1 hypothetical protein SAMN05446927_3224 [Caballeronia arationis]
MEALVFNGHRRKLLDERPAPALAALARVSIP